MSYAIRIEGLGRVQRILGTDFGPVMATAAEAVGEEIRDKIAPYPPATDANSRDNPTGRWYERGYGPRWIRKGRAARSKTGTYRSLMRLGAVGGSQTSQDMKHKWAVQKRGVGAVVSNSATYAPYLHDEEEQAKWAGERGWVTDRKAIETVVASGAIQRIILMAIRGALRR